MLWLDNNISFLMFYNKCFTLSETGVRRMALGKRVKEARIATNLSQAELGEKVGISQTAIHLMEQRDSQSSKFLMVFFSGRPYAAKLK